MMGFGMVIPIMPFYIKSFNASGRDLGLLMSTYAVMQFLFSPLWGGLSDRYGRKPILVIGILGFAVSQLFFGLSTRLWMLFASRLLAGLLSSATFPTAMAFISDSTPSEERSKGMGLIGAAMGVGMVLGPGVAGLLGNYSLATPFFVAAGLSVLALVLVVWLLPESLPASQRDTSGHKLQGPDLGAMWGALSSPIGLLLFMAFLLSFGLTAFESIFGLYALERFNYGTTEVGLLLTVVGLTGAIVQGVLTGPATRRWGEVRIVNASLAGSAIGFVLMLLAFNMLTLALTISFFVISNAMLRPIVSSLTSQRSTSGQGVAMGLNNAFMSLGRIVGPAWAGYLFDIDIHFAYLSGAAVMVIGLAVSLARLRPEPAKMAASMDAPLDERV